MLDMQGTYQYWGAKLFSYLHASVAQTYAFQMQVDSAARLWANNTLIIDATCTKHWTLTHSVTLHRMPKFASNAFCSHETLSTSLRGTAADHSGAFCLLMHSDVAACLHIMASTIRLVVSDTAFHVAGTQNGTQSTINSSYLWSGSITLPIGYYNLTIEYHNGNGSGTFIVRAGYSGSATSVSLCCYAFDVILVL